MNVKVNAADTDTVLHKLSTTYSDFIDELTLKSHGISYFAHFLTPDLECIGSSMTEAQAEECFKVYFWGVLERCHITSITSLARTNRWLKASLSQYEAGNLLGFSASLRGLLEAAADTHDASSIMVDQLYNLFPFIYLRVAKENQTAPLPLLEDLEDRLIHYSYARRQAKGSSPLPQHTNKTNTEYIRVIEKSGAVGAKDLYQLLCELTHPAAPSVSCFLNEREREILLDFSQDERIINEVVSDYAEALNALVMGTVNSALVSIVILDKMGLTVPAPFQEYFSGIPSAMNIFARIDEFLIKASVEGFVFSEEMWHYKSQVYKP